MVGVTKNQLSVSSRIWYGNILAAGAACACMEVMINCVLQSIGSYVMSIFRLPNTLLDEIEKMMNDFWWGHGGASNRGLHWLSWDNLQIHKKYGGMGFKNIPSFNFAMLGKQG